MGLVGSNPHENRKKARICYVHENQIKELIDNYDTDILWFDGDWVDWWNNETGKDLYNYIRDLKPEIIINNRVAKRDTFKKDFGTPEQEHLNNPVVHEWEACYTMNNSWGFHANDNNWKPALKVYEKLKEINKNGGNLLLNIGPDGNGNVPQDVSLLPQRRSCFAPGGRQGKITCGMNRFIAKIKKASETKFRAASPNLTETNLLAR